MATQTFRLVWCIYMISLITVSVVKADSDSMTIDDMIEMIQPMVDKCPTKPERDNIVDLVQHKEDANMPTKCLNRCMQEQVGTMSEGSNLFDVEKVVDMASMLFPEKEVKTREIVEKCNKDHATQTDKCEAAHVLSMCMLKEMRANEYNIPEIKR